MLCMNDDTTRRLWGVICVITTYMYNNMSGMHAQSVHLPCTIIYYVQHTFTVAMSIHNMPMHSMSNSHLYSLLSCMGCICSYRKSNLPSNLHFSRYILLSNSRITTESKSFVSYTLAIYTLNKLVKENVQNSHYLVSFDYHCNSL